MELISGSSPPGPDGLGGGKKWADSVDKLLALGGEGHGVSLCGPVQELNAEQALKKLQVVAEASKITVSRTDARRQPMSVG